jgi:hypothetical protein
MQEQDQQGGPPPVGPAPPALGLDLDDMRPLLGAGGAPSTSTGHGGCRRAGHGARSTGTGQRAEADAGAEGRGRQERERERERK